MSSSIAISIAPGELRLLVARTNGSVQPLHQLAAELPAGAVRSGLQAPNVTDGDAVRAALRDLVDQARSTGMRSASPAVLVPDAAVRLAIVPVDTGEPRRAEGDSMARWALRDMLPSGVEDPRVDWSVLTEDTPELGKWLVAVGAASSVIEEYESVVESVGWTAGRVIPLTLALAVGAGEADSSDGPGAARLVMSGIGGQIACLVEAGGVPRLHRAWRGAPPDLAAELRNIERFVDQRLGRSIVEAVLAGPREWQQATAEICRSLGWNVHARSSWSAHIGAVSP